MLALEVDYLSGQVYAADYRDRDKAEWPPHPARLFSALLAASFESGFGESGLEVLRWLERQDPPALRFSPASPRSEGITYVPVNDPKEEKILPSYRSKQPRTFPCMIPEENQVVFIWPDAEPDLTQRAMLDELAGEVTYLGSSRSLVRIRLSDTAPAPTLIPTQGGDTILRVVGPGRVDELNQLYELERRPTPGRLLGYAPPGEASQSTPLSTFQEMLIFRRTGGPILTVEQSLTLTQCVRNAVLALAGDEAPASLHGHDQVRHCAWVPLPFVGSKHADGRILGFAVLLPQTVERAERQRILAALAGLKTVRLPNGRAIQVESVPDDPRHTLQMRTWTSPARRWSTVTPMLLDRFPRPGKPGREISDLITRACHHMELPTPQSIVVNRGPMLPGVPPSQAFQVRRPQDRKPRPYTHVTLHFAEPVSGPMVLGAGRYFGLGLFLPLPGHQAEDISNAG